MIINNISSLLLSDIILTTLPLPAMLDSAEDDDDYSSYDDDDEGIPWVRVVIEIVLLVVLSGVAVYMWMNMS